MLVISLYMVSLENPSAVYVTQIVNKKSKLINCGKYKWSWLQVQVKYKLLISICILQTMLPQSLSEYFDKWTKIAFSSLSNVNMTLKVGITITWGFTLHYVIATTLWCWKRISYNGVTSISIGNRSTPRWKPNKKPMSPQYRVPTGRFREVPLY